MAIMPDNIRLTIHTTQYMLHSNNFIHILCFYRTKKRAVA